MNQEKSKFYIERIALAARNRLIEKHIISNDVRQFNFELLKQIVEFFGGNLVNGEETDSTHIIKNDDKKYTIVYTPNDHYIKVLHELGHAFLDFDNMKTGQIYSFDGVELEDSNASLFARAFVMPRDDFEQVVINHINDGKCSIQNIANEYFIDYFDVLIRGKELNFWE